MLGLWLETRFIINAIKVWSLCSSPRHWGQEGPIGATCFRWKFLVLTRWSRLHQTNLPRFNRDYHLWQIDLIPAANKGITAACQPWRMFWDVKKEVLATARINLRLRNKNWTWAKTQPFPSQWWDISASVWFDLCGRHPLEAIILFPELWNWSSRAASRRWLCRIFATW